LRTGNLGSNLYAPGQVPADPAALPAFLADELRKLQTAIALLAAGHIDKSYAAPPKPRDGDLIYADGTTYNPGSGKGVYQYRDDAAWHFLG
jgi:hypothetical protein